MTVHRYRPAIRHIFYAFFTIVLILSPRMTGAGTLRLDGLPPPVRDQLVHACSLLVQCGISAPQVCPQEATSGAAGVVYDTHRCSLPAILFKQALLANSTAGLAAYGFLGRQWQLIYEIDGILPMRPEQMSYIMQHLELSGNLLNSTLGGDFLVTAEVRDPPRFVRATKGNRFTGMARWLAGSATAGHMYYLGLGTASILWWDFIGQALLDFQFGAVMTRPDRTRYRVRIVVSPGSKLINEIMDLPIFHDQLESRLQAILDRLAMAVLKLQLGGIPPVSPPWSDDERSQLKELARAGEKLSAKPQRPRHRRP